MAEHKHIYASSLRGYCSEEMCWRFLHDLADALDALHARGAYYGRIDLRRIIVDGQHFLLPQDGKGDCAAADIWSLAAAAMELMLGSPILNGKGETAMKENTPVPILSNRECSAMNALLQRCLAYDKAARPAAAEVRAIAYNEVQRFAMKKREARQLFVGTKAEESDDIDKKWPESMVDTMKSTILILVLAFFTCLPAVSQTSLETRGENETAKLLSAVLMLRNASGEQWNEAQELFAKYANLVTLMDELKDRENDCLLVKKNVNHFGVNRIINAVKRGRRVQNSGKELLDGADARFKYSIYEKGVKKGCTAAYEMTKRSGKQVFVIVPYNAMQKYETVLYVDGGAVYEPAMRDKNGVTYYYIDVETGPCDSDVLKLEIANKDNDTNASFVIINHNYRNK